MELTKTDTQVAKGIGALSMVMLHLFCRLDTLPYAPFFYLGDVPFVYYLGLFGDMCVPIYCFCSGYAHALIWEKDPVNYTKRLPQKALALLKNYWIVVILFSLMGLIFAPESGMPGGFAAFCGNMLLYGMSYNGAWWFVVTYLLLLFLSPCIGSFIRKVPARAVIFTSFAVYFIAYYFRFNHTLVISQPVLNWSWEQCVLLGTSQFPYLIGSLCYHHRWISKSKNYLCQQSDSSKPRSVCKYLLKIAVVYVLPIAAFLAHCVVQSVFVAPFTAVAVLGSVFLGTLPRWFIRLFYYLGKHSTNIWLTHMFFYQYLFPNLVFSAKFPMLILVFMMVLCIASSLAVQELIKWLDLVFRSFLCRKSA